METLIVNQVCKYFNFHALSSESPLQDLILPVRQAVTTINVDLKEAHERFGLQCVRLHNASRIPLDISVTASLIDGIIENSTVKLRVSGDAIDQLLWYNKNVLLNAEIIFNNHGNAILQTSQIPVKVDGIGSFFFEYVFNDPPAEYFFQGRRYQGRIKIGLSIQEDVADVDLLSTSQKLGRKILSDKSYMDFVLSSNDGTVMPCHRSFLAAQSDYFNRMFQTDCLESRNGASKTQLCKSALYALLKFIYYQCTADADRDVRITLQLLETAHVYSISSLEDAMKTLLINKPNAWFTIEAAIWLRDYSDKVDGYQELSTKASRVIKHNKALLSDANWIKSFVGGDQEKSIHLISIISKVI